MGLMWAVAWFEADELFLEIVIADNLREAVVKAMLKHHPNEPYTTDWIKEAPDDELKAIQSYFIEAEWVVEAKIAFPVDDE